MRVSNDSFCQDDFVGAKLYCPHAFADGNQCIQIKKKTPEFSGCVLVVNYWADLQSVHGFCC